jgi:hypothetical protein
MNQLPQATKDRIKKEAKKYMRDRFPFAKFKNDSDYEGGSFDVYKDATTAEALRAQPLLEALEKIAHFASEEDWADNCETMKGIASKALLNYNQ